MRTLLRSDHGTLTLNSDGSYSYVVNQDDSAVQGLRTASDTVTDTFRSEERRVGRECSSTSLTVPINGKNDEPVAVVDVAGETETGGMSNGTAGVDPTGNVLTNDTDVDNVDTKTVRAFKQGT